MALFIPRHKEITAMESTNLSITNLCRLHGAPKVIVSDRDPMFVGKFRKNFMGRLNTNVSTARHPRTDSLTKIVNPTMQTL